MPLARHPMQGDRALASPVYPKIGVIGCTASAGRPEQVSLINTNRIEKQDTMQPHPFRRHEHQPPPVERATQSMRQNTRCRRRSTSPNEQDSLDQKTSQVPLAPTLKVQILERRARHYLAGLA